MIKIEVPKDIKGNTSALIGYSISIMHHKGEHEDIDKMVKELKTTPFHEKKNILKKYVELVDE